MDKAKILERWKDLDAQRAQKKKEKSESITVPEEGHDSTQDGDPTTSTSQSTAESNTQRSTGSWTMVSEEPSTAPSTQNGGSGLQPWGSEPPSPVVTDIFKLIADLEQQPGRDQDALKTAESHAYAMEMELQNCRTAQELDAKRIRELEERLHVAERQVEKQRQAIEDLRTENAAQDGRIVELEQRVQGSATGTKAEEKKPTFPPTVKKKVSSLFRRDGSACGGNRR